MHTRGESFWCIFKKNRITHHTRVYIVLTCVSAAGKDSGVPSKKNESHTYIHNGHACVRRQSKAE